MRLIPRLLGALAGIIAVFALSAAAATASQHHQGHHHGPPPPPHRGPGPDLGAAALFAQTDDPAGNSIVAYRRFPDGHLAEAGSYPTGGAGGVLEGSVVDHLASQGSLAYDPNDHLLYAVNAGSDSVTVFAVGGDRLLRLQVISSGGDFPVSVAVHGHLVYVLNGRGGGSIQGYISIAGHLVAVPGWNRQLGLDPNATPEFTNTPGQVAFTPGGSQLVVTTKANGSAVDVFGIGPFGAPSAQPTVNPLPGAVPFAVEFDQGGRPLFAEAGTNAVASFDLDGGGVLHPIASASTGQEATCWIARVSSHVYVSNAGSGTVSGYSVGGSGELTPLGNTATHGGTVDAASVDGRFLYVQTGAEGVVDEFRVEANGALVPLGSVTVPGAIGGEGIAAS